MENRIALENLNQTSDRKRTKLLTALIAVLLVSTIALGVLLYSNSLESSQKIASLNDSVSSLQREQAASLQLVSENGTYPGRSYFSSNSSQINPGAIYDYANASIVTVQGLQQSSSFFGTTYVQVLGSGFVVEYGNSDYIVTNYHVVGGDVNISVTFSNGDAYSATVVGSDPYSDLAVLSTSAPASDFRPLTLAASSSLHVGDPVVAIGNPFGLSGSMTEGLVSQLGRTIQDPTAGNYSIANVIQMSAGINPGNSGGPLLNSYGQVVGMTTATVSGSQSIGFAIPSDTLFRELPDIITTGSYNLHPYLGISEADMSYDLARASGTNVTYGVLVETVVSGGPASIVGLRGGTSIQSVDGSQYYVGGDIIVSVNGTRVVNSDALSSWLEEHALPGQVVLLGIVRSGISSVVSLTLGQRPPLS